jgi:hypothetical protein
VHRDTARLEAFSDGVFAITITLLILDIKPPTDYQSLLHGLRELEEQRDSGVVLPSGRGVTVEQWMNLWLETIASRKVRPSTLTGYRRCLKRINLVLGDTTDSTSSSLSTWRPSTPGWKRTGCLPRRRSFTTG